MKHFFISLGILLAFQVQAKLTIEITQGIDNPTPIAVSPFSYSGKGTLLENISQIITDDLSRTGMFTLLPTSAMLSHPDVPEEVYYRDWRALKQDYLLIGRVDPVVGELDRIKVNFQLYDIHRQKVLMSEQMVASTRGLRDVSHRISDKVFEKLTNIRGAFSTKILYVSSQTRYGKERFRLWVADADGARAKAIVDSNEPIVSPAWSPDGKRIAYVSFEDRRPSIYIQELTTGKRQKMTAFKGLNGSPSFSPDGKKLAMVLSKDGSPSVYVMDIATKNLKMVGSHRLAIDTEPQWMPDGKRILFTSNRGGSPQLYEVNVATNQVKRVTFDGRYNARGRPVPDGSGIVMVHLDSNNFYIARQDFSTGRIHVLSDTKLDESPSIAANGSMVMYATKRDNRGVLAAVSIDGRIRFVLPSHGEDVREPAWSPFLTN